MSFYNFSFGISVDIILPIFRKGKIGNNSKINKKVM